MLARLAALPQAWLVPFGLAGLMLGWLLPDLPRLRPLGWLIVAGGLALMGWAALVMQRARTTVWPGQRPARLVTWGPFALSRNPIYLGDLILLAGVFLVANAPAGLVVLPGFALFLTRRFILSEEAMVQDAFGAEFSAYRRKTRRWL
ncbi:methyltransferase family protein [Paracoccus laeviglucosivorans]|uniref:Protein-S-isoprenylcysteine O-methyltransferase Ste14 n=1 Tax=Paracoccus laeviglucosivorans TaxID=1197861 RepID=A0A521FVJ4_9RHOB|nr:isoprenylcysteine carboxylmethyltransferase family protein [Paracoccus laeviglucosivorans]SMP00172.1 Protein-S-isoprenylcysteine O-methyltransferase Ste14 [Paracoccus laeviglucosivorans]